jgi:hypothetical protein
MGTMCRKCRDEGARMRRQETAWVLQPRINSYRVPRFELAGVIWPVSRGSSGETRGRKNGGKRKCLKMKKMSHNIVAFISKRGGDFANFPINKIL